MFFKRKYIFQPTITITTPTDSELIYNTATVNDVTPGFYYWDGSHWNPLGATESLETYTYPTLLNGYSNFGGAHNLTKYYKEKGRVYLNGVIRGSASYNTPMFILPPEYRPSKRLILPAYSAGTTNGRIDILPNGEVIFYYGGTLVSLDGLSFRVD